jgi:hypothetical protein
MHLIDNSKKQRQKVKNMLSKKAGPNFRRDPNTAISHKIDHNIQNQYFSEATLILSWRINTGLQS